jgi:hypothetical protein
MNPPGETPQQPPLRIPPVRQGYRSATAGAARPRRPAPRPPVRKRAAAYMAPAFAPRARVRQESLGALPPPRAARPAPAPAGDDGAAAAAAWVRYVHVSGDPYWHNAATGESRWTEPKPAPPAPAPAALAPSARRPVDGGVGGNEPAKPAAAAAADSSSSDDDSSSDDEPAKPAAKAGAPPAPASASNRPVVPQPPQSPAAPAASPPPSPPKLRVDPTAAAAVAPIRAPAAADARPPLSGFMLFTKEMRPKVKAEEPDLNFGGLGKRLGELWRGLSDADKARWTRADPPPVVLAARPPSLPPAATAAELAAFGPTEGPRGKGPLAFPQELFGLVADNVDAALSSDLVAWSRDGERVVFLEPQAFAERVCPRVWKHNKWSSLTRQLNMYGFLRCGEVAGAAEPASYEHEAFKKGRPDLLAKVKRTPRERRRADADAPEAPAPKPRGKRPFYGNQYGMVEPAAVDHEAGAAALPEIGDAPTDVPMEAVQNEAFDNKPARLGGTHPPRNEDDDPRVFRPEADAACAAAFLKRGAGVKSDLAAVAAELAGDGTATFNGATMGRQGGGLDARATMGRVLRYYYATFKRSAAYPAAKTASQEDFEEGSSGVLGRGMRLRRKRAGDDDNADPINELRYAVKGGRSMRDCFERLDARTLRAVRNAANYALDARLDEAVTEKPPPRKRPRAEAVAPKPKTRPRYEPETPEQASRAALDALRGKLRDRGQAGRDLLAGWTASRERNVRHDGTSNGFSYVFTDPDGEAYISLSKAARAALHQGSGDTSDESEAEEAPAQDHRLLGVVFDYSVSGLGWCRGRVARVVKGGLLGIRYPDLPETIKTAPRALAAREVDAAFAARKPKGASYYVAPQRQFATARRGSPGPKLEKLESFPCGGCDRAFTTLSGRSNHHRYCEAGRAFAAAEAAAHALGRSDDDDDGSDAAAASASPTPTPPEARDSPSLAPPRKFPCPDGCDRTFSHAPAAVQHGKTCKTKRLAAMKAAAAEEEEAPATAATAEEEAPTPAPFASPPDSTLSDAEARVLLLAEEPPPIPPSLGSPRQPTWWPNSSP